MIGFGYGIMWLDMQLKMGLITRTQYYLYLMRGFAFIFLTVDIVWSVLKITIKRNRDSVLSLLVREIWIAVISVCIIVLTSLELYMGF